MQNNVESSYLAAVGRQFPRLQGESVAGRPTTVPARAGALGYLVMLTFEPWNDRDARSWQNPARSAFSRLPGIRAFWAQVFPALNVVARWVIRRRLARAVHDAAMRQVTVTVFGDMETLRAQLGLPADEAVFVFAVDADGTILGVVGGAWSFEKERALATSIGTSRPLSGERLSSAVA